LKANSWRTATGGLCKLFIDTARKQTAAEQRFRSGECSGAGRAKAKVRI
jgi:hypothetical protein